MLICITIGGKKHCFVVPIIEFSLAKYRPRPGPVNFPELFRDATILASVHAAASHVSDPGVREALNNGIKVSAAALANRAGEHVNIELPAFKSE